MSTTNKNNNGRPLAAALSAGGALGIALITQLGSQPWWVTVSLMTSITALGIVYMLTSAWGERPPPPSPIDVAALLAARLEPQSYTPSNPPPGMSADAWTEYLRTLPPPPKT